MQVMSHRGYWKTPTEKNLEVAFRRSFDLGFGTETDVRDCAGELVISHDPPRGGEMTFAHMLDMLGERDLPMALNIKADGLAKSVREEMLKRPHLTKWFVFDMSIPDTLQQLLHGNPVFSRQSEYEPTPALLNRANGIWLDAFVDVWWNPDLLNHWTMQGKTVCIVSPDLHRRDPAPCWEMLRSAKLEHSDQVWLCTDFPEDAVRALGGTS
jgi:hypothetical protein